METQTKKKKEGILMLISGTLWLIFSAILILLNQIHLNFYSAPNLLVIALLVVSFPLGLFFYYKAGLFNVKNYFSDKNNFD